MEVTELSVNTFWKGESEIKGMVLDGKERYRVRILRKGSQIYDYSCSHVTGTEKACCSMGCAPNLKEETICAHVKAVWEAQKKKEQTEQLKPVSTSQKIRFMIREYTNREVGRIMGAAEEGTIRIAPVVSIAQNQVRVRFMVGRGRLYAVRDLSAFSNAMENGSYAEYGKGAGFHHSLGAFCEEDRPLVLMIMERIGFYREQNAQLRRTASGLEAPLKELLLGKAGVERLFAILEGRQAELEDSVHGKRTVTVEHRNPEFEILVEKTGRDGVRLSVGEEISAFRGENSLFVINGDKIYICDEEYTTALSVFMEYLVMGQEGERSLSVNDRDMPLFYERVLKRLEAMRLLNVRGIELDSYRPKELKARFFFDSPAPDTVTLYPELSYGDFSFHPLEDEKAPKEVCRDVPGEFRISQLVTEFFPYREDGTKNLVIRNDDDTIYRLVSGGISRFIELGEVFVSEAFQRIRRRPPAGVSVQVRMTGSWLELTVDTGDIPRQELKDILAAYGKKKSYYRMKSGEFLTLGDSGLLTLSAISKNLDVEKEFLESETVQLPMYRAMFLDGALKEDKSVLAYRDQLFKAIVRGMRDVEDSDFEIPLGFSSVLREYQKLGYRWLKTLDAYGFGGILADEMGLGKTIQVIALLTDWHRQEKGTSLIVCPASLIYNWENEFRTFSPALSVQVIAGSQTERESLLRDSQDTDVLITSYDLLKRDICRYQGREFRFEIIDEAQYIKNSLTQTAKAVKMISSKTRFALTGTPIENHLGELWSIFDFLMPGFLFTAGKFRKKFESPIVRDGDKDALELLKKLTGPFILRRMKRDVLKELPDKLETVLYSSMEGEQKKLYMASALELKEKLLSGKADTEDRMQILADLMRLRQICCEPSLCFSGYRSGSAKLETCMELLSNGTAAGHKILLFSQFTSMLDRIAARLKKEKIAYYLLTGSTSGKDRMQMVTSFKRDEVPVFLISLKAGGTGLNLTSADMVIHYDPWWNVAAQNQATDRAHRIGQENQVTVFRLITKHTIEENILKLQEQKRKLADTVVTEGTASFGGFTREELLKLLEEE